MPDSSLSARQWLRENGYYETALMIDEIEDEWQRAGKKTRRNWWDVLAGDRKGAPRTIEGRLFPVLKAAQIRQGVPITVDDPAPPSKAAVLQEENNFSPGEIEKPGLLARLLKWISAT